MAKPDILLDHVFLKNRLAELGIKQWWLAEQLGVDRRTVVRWIQGHVKSVQAHNVQNLARVLDCSPLDLELANEALQVATPSDQQLAAALLMKSSLIDKLGPIGEWNIVEALLKASIVPHLPLSVLGELYDKLTIAAWRQSKLELAETYNRKTTEIAHKTGDRGLAAAALLSRANLLFWRGDVAGSIEAYEQCQGHAKYVEPRLLGAASSNLGSALYESGDLEAGRPWIRKSIEIFSLHGKPTNLAIAHGHLAIIEMKSGELEKAARHARTSIEHAQVDDYRRGKAFGKLILGELAARTSEHAKAVALVDESLEDFQRLAIVEGLNFEFAGRIHRLLGNLERARSYVREGIRAAQAYPVYRAALLLELAEVERAGDAPDWRAKVRDAIELYQQCGCGGQVKRLQAQFGSI